MWLLVTTSITFRQVSMPPATPVLMIQSGVKRLISSTAPAAAYLTDAALHQYESVLTGSSFGEFERAADNFFFVVQKADHLVVLHAHGGYYSDFHTLICYFCLQMYGFYQS